MSSKRKSFYTTLLFVVLFIVPQVILFTWLTYNISNPFWIVYLSIIAVYAIVHFKEWTNTRTMRMPLLFAFVSVIGAILSTFADVPLGGVLMRISTVFVGLIGFSYLVHNRLNVDVFKVLIPALYLLFYFAYFVFNESVRQDINHNTFGHSSSNTIAIVLNTVWFFYYIIARAQKNDRRWSLLVFGIINLVLIIIQGSRAGIFVAALDIILVISDMTKMKSLVFILLVLAIVYAFGRYSEVLSEIMDVEGMRGMASLEEDARGEAQSAFFANMNTDHFLFGYPPGTVFGGESRTYNAFLDFWSTFGFLPFGVLVILLIKRVFNWKRYSLNLIAFMPWLFYSMVESIWGGRLWDILVYIVLFYSYGKDYS